MTQNLSLIIPVYNEQDNIKPLVKKILPALDKLHLKNYEILFIDDGSTDKTNTRLHKIANKKNKIRVITHKKNFGKATAYSVGFSQAKYDVIITLDGDLQDDPSEMKKFINKLNQGYDLVVGWKKQGKGSWNKTILSRFFNIVTNWIFKLDLHDLDCPFKAYRKEVIKGLKLYSGLYRFIPVFAQSVGFKVTEIEIKNLPRYSGDSKYGPGRIIRGFLDFLTVVFITRFNLKPMHFFGSLALISAFTGTLILIYLSWLHFQGQKIGDRPLFQLGTLLEIMSLQFFSIGFIGEMLTRSLIKIDLEYLIKEEKINQQ
ncbi:glycosyltransferase family 2 protein [Patescibacteria group bacterium]